MKDDNLLQAFLQNFKDVFSLKSYCALMEELGIKVSTREVRQILEDSTNVFSLGNDKYITKAGVFSGAVFSIKPTLKEFEQKAVAIGGRCIPFVDGENFFYGISFYNNGRKLKSKTGTFDSDFAMSIFKLYGLEYAPQYIAADPANAELNISQNDFQLPKKVNLTCFDLAPLIKNGGFKFNDRLICTVEDWCCGKIDVRIEHEEDCSFGRGKSADKRLGWYNKVEEHLLEQFERKGPMSCMEEQLACLFFENMEDLSVDYCGSIEEYLERYARKVDIEDFGVETRLWRKGETVPAVGKWNYSQMAGADRKSILSHDYEEIVFEIPGFIYDESILDMFYRRENNFSCIIERLFLSHQLFSEDCRNELLLLLKKRSCILVKDYNRFADRIAGRLRQKALVLYSKVVDLVYRIDSENLNLELLPQQELVTLSQLLGHLTGLIQSITNRDNLERDAQNISLSLDGMAWNFESVREELEQELERQHSGRFKVY